MYHNRYEWSYEIKICTHTPSGNQKQPKTYKKHKGFVIPDDEGDIKNISVFNSTGTSSWKMSVFNIPLVNSREGHTTPLALV